MKLPLSDDLLVDWTFWTVLPILLITQPKYIKSSSFLAWFESIYQCSSVLLKLIFSRVLRDSIGHFVSWLVRPSVIRSFFKFFFRFLNILNTGRLKNFFYH